MTEFKFNKLTPLNDIDIDSSYIEAMKYALEDEDIKNIAISLESDYDIDKLILKVMEEFVSILWKNSWQESGKKL